ncbi:MAG: bifunctional tetrahydrofolate synthase/dihydrofolate synthase [Gammaproteobacteria bacterium]|jgi:dihydrofolate synthase / folylpolyglutamate synthase|nr:bifunctional tetrahydrofolate synthase/dihydrofolate synthase [Gammaproteobacteria bacterium]MBT5223042.1 bifunctional tetrahydrofolate synthase/dihydrofolate synthase [Gammaproteobacteria bacterium]MBT5825557.1 bifunctional tetrahydrofolate synthase/dihydrofolate synthase [Gammaproteobacteria bacterium]MBT6420314.1 bifunctional tetrahydrofolate synthase/dihydrofolate synthase [Gammaproteobacteria bacterium]MBT6576845.1 bifunctional tetrahydrofolate synthase/dihydrofolate synthase [Gammaprot
MHFETLKGWLDWQESLHPQSIDLGLDRVTRVFNALARSAHKKLVTITVAGTNGKGSSIAFLEAIYLAQGLRVGAYTSPHIINYNERIKINGIAVSDQIICAAFERIEAVRNNISLSYFEFGTLAALDIFSRSGLDIQLLEVGLGGRLDAVNMIDPDAVIVTSISIDHTTWLGETREAIAYEKAGVFRANTAAITGDLDPPKALQECATKINIPLLRLGHEFTYHKNATGWDWRYGDNHLDNLPAPQLKGEHQYRNASSVLTAITNLQPKITVSEQAIKQGLSSVKLLGRFQLIKLEPLSKSEPPVLLDVSHNPQAAQALIDHLQADFKNTPVHAIFTMMNDKDLSGVISLMQPFIKHWYISPLDNPRTSTEIELKNAFQHCRINDVSLGFKDFLSSYSAAKVKAQSDQGIILIFGSFFLVSEYLTLFSNPQGQ